MYLFALVVLSFFALIGVCHFLRGLVRAFSRPPKDREMILIKPIKSPDNAEFLLRSAAGKVLWMGRYAPDSVIALDCDMDDETRKICGLVCRDYPFMKLCSRDELKSIIETI